LWRAGVDILLVWNKVHTKRAEFVEGGDQSFGGWGESVVSPDKYNVGLSLSHEVEELLILRALFIPAGGVVDKLVDDRRATRGGILAQLVELGFGVLFGLMLMG
jgi:hypothetical protein